MNFPYLRVATAMDSLEIEEVGNCCIRAFNDEGEEFILIVDTQLGTTRVFKYGPVCPDLELLPQNVTCTFSRMNFNQPKVAKIITQFLNEYTSKITQAELIDKEEALKDCRSIIEYMKQDILY